MPLNSELIKTRLGVILDELVTDKKLTLWEALAIYRCCKYSDQIADVSLGNLFRPDVESLLKEN